MHPIDAMRHKVIKELNDQAWNELLRLVRDPNTLPKEAKEEIFKNGIPETEMRGASFIVTHNAHEYSDRND